MEAVNINPTFDDLHSPETIISHVEQLKAKSEATPHTEILHTLIEQFEPIDFEKIAFKNLEKSIEELNIKLASTTLTTSERKRLNKQLDKLENLTVNTKHHLIISIEKTLEVAQKNNWNLCKNHDFIYLYNGSFWNEIDKETFQKFLGEASEKMGVTKFSARFYQFREQLFKQFLFTAYLPTPEQENKTVLINLLNGTFEICQNGKTKLRPFEHKDFITYQLPFEYNPQAKAPLFEAYLNKVLPDTERQRVLAEYLGFVFVKHGSNVLKEEKALILYGTGANGKSVFFEIVTAMFGRQNVSNYSLQSLTEEKGFYRAKISNKLVNYASEINGKLETSIFKQLVSGEPVEACLKYGQPFTMTDYAKFIFNCNELPKDVEHTNAYFRRFLIIPFDVTISEHEQDKNLHAKIIETELSGVFNWVLEGLNRLLEQKRFTECKASNEALKKYKVESDSVQMFLSEENYSISIEKDISLKDFFAEYRAYCIDSGFKPCSRRTFTDRLRNVGFETHRKNIGTVVNAEKKVFS